MALVVKEDESLDPSYVRFLVPEAIVARADRLTDAVQ